MSLLCPQTYHVSGSQSLHKPYLGKWESYCSQWQINPLCATAVDGMNFLAELFQSGVGYSAIKTARSALSSILILPDNTTFGPHPLVSRLLKGVSELRFALPKYQSIWDISVVLNLLGS